MLDKEIGPSGKRPDRHVALHVGGRQIRIEHPAAALQQQHFVHPLVLGHAHEHVPLAQHLEDVIQFVPGVRNIEAQLV